MFGTSQARASLEITWPLMRKHRFDSSQSHGFVVFSCHEAGAWVDGWYLRQKIRHKHFYLAKMILL